MYNDELTQFDVLGVGVTATNMQSATAEILGWVRMGLKKYVCFSTAYGVMESQRDRDLLNAFNHSGMTVPDGMPLVWLGKRYGHRAMGRVYGPDLMLEVCRASLPFGYSHFLYGGNIGVAEDLRDELKRRLPGIRIAGIWTPPYRELLHEEELNLARTVAEAKPDFMWIGLGTPKQERFMARYIDRLDVKVMLGVGAAFDYLSGRSKDAPAWMKRCGMQWAHRLYREPRRLWKRYLVNNPVFVYRCGIQLMKELIWQKN